MTCEIAILNREAVALAADSAVTITGDKIYNSANKLFALSKCQPVGIMIFGSDNFMGVPWETVIKIFRKQLEGNDYDTLKQYGDEFINFLKLNTLNIPKSLEEQRQKDGLTIFLNNMKSRITQLSDEAFEKRGKVQEHEVKEFVKTAINEQYEQQAKNELFEWATKEFQKKVKDKYLSYLKEATNNILEKLPLDEEAMTKLTDAAFMTVFNKTHWTTFYSGVVIAGFGKKEIFPSLVEYGVDCLVEGQVKASVFGELKIDGIQNNAWLAPYAQAEEAQMFIRGIHPILKSNIHNMIENSFHTLENTFVNVTEGQLKEQTKTDLKNAIPQIISDFKNAVETQTQQLYVDPLMQMVTNLPRSELAAMAESLVNLSSFKKHVTNDKETVGGNVDVAIVSKADGFIWIKKKRYFDSEINPHNVVDHY